MTTDKKTQEKPDVKKQKVARQQVTKQKQVMKAHEKPIAHKAPANNTTRPTVMKQQVENNQVTKKISVQDLFAIPTVSQMNSKPQQIPKQHRAMSNNLPIQQNSPTMHKTRSYTYGTSMQSQMAQNTPPKTRGASPPTGAYANPAYSDSPSAREVPMPPLNWLFEGATTTTTTKPLTGTDFMRVFAVAPVN